MKLCRQSNSVSLIARPQPGFLPRKKEHISPRQEMPPVSHGFEGGRCEPSSRGRLKSEGEQCLPANLLIGFKARIYSGNSLPYGEGTINGVSSHPQSDELHTKRHIFPFSPGEKDGMRASVFSTAWFRLGAAIGLWVLVLGTRALAADTTNSSVAVAEPAPVNARDFYNAGTHLLAARKFAEAESLLDSALAAQDDQVQPPAMYNLGLTRFGEGVEFLQKGPDAAKASARGQAALAAGDHAIARAESALAENDLDAMVGAYLEGRGVRHELHEAQKAVQAAMETYGKTLQKWQRADNDFKGAAELNPADTNATQNAAETERAIAKLIDSLRKMQGMMGAMDQKRQQLGQALGKLKGRIPAPDAPPGSAGEGDEDDDGTTPGDLAGQKEGAAREGDQIEMQLSPEKASQILDGLSLDGSRRLSMSDQQGGPPKDRKGRNW